MKCPICGYNNRTGAKFCLKCGTPQKSPGQSKKPIGGQRTIGLTAIVIIAVGLAALVMVSRPPDGQSAPVSGTDTSRTAPSPTPDSRLFWDDFEAGIKPDWLMRGDNFNAVNGRLVSEGALTGGVGDLTWTDYQVTLKGWRVSRSVILRFRVQDENNYVEMQCGWVSKSTSGCRWYKVSDGERKEIPATEHRNMPRRPSIELKGSTYRVVELETGQEIVRFVDDTVSYGGITLMVQSGEFELDGFEVDPLP